MLVVRSQPEQLARGARRPARAPARVPGVRGRVGRRQQLAAVARDPRRHPAADRGRAVGRRDPRRTYVAQYTEKILLTPSNAGLGIVAWGLPALAVIARARPASSSRCGGGAVRLDSRRPTRTRRSSRREREPSRADASTTGRAHERSTARSSKPSASSCCGRSTTSTAELRRRQHRPRHLPVLHDDYTARAAAVIRSLDDGVDRRRRAAPRRRPPCALLTIGGIVVFALLAAILLAHAIGQRRPDRRSRATRRPGGTTTAESTGPLAAKAARGAAEELRARRSRTPRALLSTGDYPDAIQQFPRRRSSTRSRPSRSRTRAGSGARRRGRSRIAATTEDRSFARRRTSLDQAIRPIRPTLTPTRSRDLLLAQVEKQDCAGAVPRSQQFLVTAPTDHPMRPTVLDRARRSEGRATAPNRSRTPTTKP